MEKLSLINPNTKKPSKHLHANHWITCITNYQMKSSLKKTLKLFFGNCNYVSPLAQLIYQNDYWNQISHDGDGNIIMEFWICDLGRLFIFSLKMKICTINMKTKLLKHYRLIRYRQLNQKQYHQIKTESIHKTCQFVRWEYELEQC